MDGLFIFNKIQEACQLAVLIYPNYNQAMTTTPWYHKTSIYHLYPRSFMDSNGDGIADQRSQPDVEGEHDIRDEVAFRGEVVDDRTVVDAEVFGDSAEGECAQAVAQRQLDRRIQEVLTLVPVTHEHRS